MLSLCDSELGGDGQDEGTPLLPLPPVPPWREGEEEEGELSDLDPDIEEYIATETEVCMRGACSVEPLIKDPTNLCTENLYQNFVTGRAEEIGLSGSSIQNCINTSFIIATVTHPKNYYIF